VRIIILLNTFGIQRGDPYVHISSRCAIILRRKIDTKKQEEEKDKKHESKTERNIEKRRYTYTVIRSNNPLRVIDNLIEKICRS
jgi:hypothetical protein